MNIELLTCERRARGSTPWLLSAARILPERRPRFCVQLLHGFSEHKERWFPLMQFLAACGGVVLAHDLRGHGASVPAGKIKHPEDGVAELGYDYELLRDDIDAVYSAFGDPWGEEIPDPAGERPLPRFLFGHSMGALMAAAYAARRSRSVDGLILSGLPHRERFVSAALFGLGLESVFTGDARCPKGLNRNAFTRYNKAFAPEPESSGEFLWLTNDPDVRDAFAADPLCNRLHPLGDYRNLLRLVRDVWRSSFWDKPSDIPVLLLAGERDPIAGGDDWMVYAGQFLSDMGFSSIDERMYWGLRHEIFMDEGRQTPFADTARFCLTHLPGKTAAAPAPVRPVPSGPEPPETGDEPEPAFVPAPDDPAAPEPEPAAAPEDPFVPESVLSDDPAQAAEADFAPDSPDDDPSLSDLEPAVDWAEVFGGELPDELASPEEEPFFPAGQAEDNDDEEDPPADEPEPELFLAPKADPNTAAGKEQGRPDEEYGDELLFLDDGEPEDGAR